MRIRQLSKFHYSQLGISVSQKLCSSQMSKEFKFTYGTKFTKQHIVPVFSYAGNEENYSSEKRKATGSNNRGCLSCCFGGNNSNNIRCTCRHSLPFITDIDYVSKVYCLSCLTIRADLQLINFFVSLFD